MAKNFRTLIQKYGPHFPEDTVTLNDLTNRKQQKGESLRDFGKALTKMAQKVLNQTPMDSLDEHIKNLFESGIFNLELRYKAMEKILKMKNEPFSMEQLMEYVVSKEDARKVSHRFTTTFGESFSSGDAYYCQNKQQTGYTGQEMVSSRQENRFNPGKQSNTTFSRASQNYNPNLNSESTINVVLMGSRNRRHTRETLQGVALFDYSLVNYMCDSGTVKTIISEKAFNRIRVDDPQAKLIPYKGRVLK